MADDGAPTKISFMRSAEPATSINRMYLKMKSELLPYAYSIAQESVMNAANKGDVSK